MYKNTWYGVLIFLGVLILSFQNCGRYYAFDHFNNGGGYSGLQKDPGESYSSSKEVLSGIFNGSKEINNNLCPAETLDPNQIIENELEYNYTNTCKDGNVPATVDDSDIISQDYNPDYLLYNDTIFYYSESEIVLKEDVKYVKMWCRHFDFLDGDGTEHGTDIVVYQKYDKHFAKIYRGYEYAGISYRLESDRIRVSFEVDYVDGYTPPTPEPEPTPTPDGGSDGFIDTRDDSLDSGDGTISSGDGDRERDRDRDGSTSGSDGYMSDGSGSGSGGGSHSGGSNHYMSTEESTSVFASYPVPLETLPIETQYVDEFEAKADKFDLEIDLPTEGSANDPFPFRGEFDGRLFGERVDNMKFDCRSQNIPFDRFVPGSGNPPQGN